MFGSGFSTRVTDVPGEREEAFTTPSDDPVVPSTFHVVSSRAEYAIKKTTFQSVPIRP